MGNAYCVVKSYNGRLKLTILKTGSFAKNKKPLKLAFTPFSEFSVECSDNDNLFLATLDNEERVKQANNLSRSRGKVYELALCNDWEYFATFTLSEDKGDRFNLDEFKKKLSQFIRNYRRLHNCDIQYLLVPEPHRNGAWHCHGLLKGIPPEHLSKFEKGEHPLKLVNSDYLNWERYQKAFGFCSLGAVKSHEAVAGYITKYVTKNMTEAQCGNIPLFKHSFLASRGLKKAEVLFQGQFNFEQEMVFPFENEFVKIKWLEDNEVIFNDEFTEIRIIDKKTGSII